MPPSADRSLRALGRSLDTAADGPGRALARWTIPPECEDARPLGPTVLPRDATHAAPGVPSTARIVVLVMALAILPYLNTLQSGFTFDDRPDIIENPVVTHGVDLPAIFASPLPPGDLYRPLTVLSFSVNQWLTPDSPVFFHLFNVLLHAGVTLLVLALALRLFGNALAAALAAALFAVHPIHTEAVTSIVGRAELLAALFGLLAVVTALAADTAGSVRQRRLMDFASLAAFALALLSKESAATVLPLIVLARVTVRAEPLGTGVWREMRRLDWLPYLLCIAAFAAVRFLVVGAAAISTVSPLDNALAFVPWVVRLRSALGVLWDYFGLLLVPLVLAADYSYGQVPLVRSWSDARCLGGLVLLAAALVVLVRNRRPAVTYATVFPLIAIALTANILFPIGTMKAERLLYLPSVGWALLTAYGGTFLLVRRRYRALGAVGILVVMTAYAGRSWVRNQDWTNNEVLYQSMARSAPNSAKSLYNSGMTLQYRGKDLIAAAEFRRALQIFPWGGGEGSAFGLGLLYEKHGQFDRAVSWYRKALELNGGYQQAHLSLCRLLLGVGRAAEAAAACREGLRHAPADPDLLKGLGYSLMLGHEREKGLAVLERALAQQPGDPVLRAQLRRWRDAAADATGVRP